MGTAKRGRKFGALLWEFRRWLDRQCILEVHTLTGSLLPVRMGTSHVRFWDKFASIHRQNLVFSNPILYEVHWFGRCRWCKLLPSTIGHRTPDSTLASPDFGGALSPTPLTLYPASISPGSSAETLGELHFLKMKGSLRDCRLQGEYEGPY